MDLKKFTKVFLKKFTKTLEANILILGLGILGLGILGLGEVPPIIPCFSRDIFLMTGGTLGGLKSLQKMFRKSITNEKVLELFRSFRSLLFYTTLYIFNF